MPIYLASPEALPDDNRPLPATALQSTRGLSSSKIIVGWREWLALPALGIRSIKAKIDTGARTSALHAYFVEPYREKGASMVRFGIHPLQGNTEITVECHADVIDTRSVTDSGGHRENRVFISTPVALAGIEWPVELSLTNRDNMRFRMLLGRQALKGRFLVDSQASYATGKALAQQNKSSSPHS